MSTSTSGPTPTPSADSPSPGERSTVGRAGADVVHVVLSEAAWLSDSGEAPGLDTKLVRAVALSTEDACRGLERMARLLNETPRFARRYLNDATLSELDALPPSVTRLFPLVF